jgi:hypothetical protein
MEHWSRGTDIVGSAGILPAAAGMLPVASARIAIDLATHNAHRFVKSCPAECRTERATCPRSPSTFTIHDVTIHEVHANRADI